MPLSFFTKSKSAIKDSGSTLLSFGSTTEGKEHWKAKDLPPSQYVQIYRPKKYWESAQRLIDESKTKAFVTWASSYLSHEDAIKSRRETLQAHSVPFETEHFAVAKTFDGDYFEEALRSGVDTDDGDYRWVGIQQPKKWEAFLLTLRALPVRFRSYEDDARFVKHRLVGSSDWGYAKIPRADPVGAGTRLGDYYKRPGGTITTIDHTGRLWEWTKGAKGFSDEYPGEKSRSGSYAWQLCPGQPEEPKITKFNYRTSLGSAVNVRLHHWGMTEFPSADAADEALSRSLFTPVESDTGTSHLSRPSRSSPSSRSSRPSRDPRLLPAITEVLGESDDNYESYDNYGEGPSSRA